MSLQVYHQADLRPGLRVQIHPGCDRWMMGDMYGGVLEVKDNKVRLLMDRSKDKLWFALDRILTKETDEHEQEGGDRAG